MKRGTDTPDTCADALVGGIKNMKARIPANKDRNHLLFHIITGVVEILLYLSERHCLLVFELMIDVSRNLNGRCLYAFSISLFIVME